nr:MAG TPA: hypothetical protein [Caudoviricetes sp.]
MAGIFYVDAPQQVGFGRGKNIKARFVIILSYLRTEKAACNRKRTTARLG